MPESVLTLLAGIIVAGVSAQWLAWRVGLPSILVLLGFGLIAGPVTGWIDPDEIFGSLLFPIVSISVALILYEGGLTLKVSELPDVGALVRNLVTIGAAITWTVTALAAHFILGLDPSLSALLGAILVVTGPTVVAPMLRHIRPAGIVGPVLRWEGIVIDPIGASLTVLIFEVILIGEAAEATHYVVVGVLKTVVLGGGLGLTAAAILVISLQRYWIADHLKSAVSLMLVVGTFTLANAFQHESGLLAVTVMGFALANQKRADIEHIVEFKENLRVLLIAGLFIVLAARLELSTLTQSAGTGLLFVTVLVLVARPLSVFVSTLRSPLTVRQRLFLAWMAPRGIVAAAISSVFAMRLESEGYQDAGVLASATFMTIITTVAVYGLSAPLVARLLGVAESNPQGVLFVGAQGWCREIASLLQREGFTVLLVDSNRDHTQAARMAGLPTYSRSILADQAIEEINPCGLGHFLATTPNDGVNILAVQRFSRVFGSAGCYQLPPEPQGSKDTEHKHLHGRWLFDEQANHTTMERNYAAGFIAKATRISDEFDYAAFRERYGQSAIPLFIIDVDRRLHVIMPESKTEPDPGDTLIAFVLDEQQDTPTL